MTPAPPSASALNSATVSRASSQTSASRSGAAESAISSSNEILIWALHRLQRRNEPLAIDFRQCRLHAAGGHLLGRVGRRGGDLVEEQQDLRRGRMHVQQRGADDARGCLHGVLLGHRGGGALCVLLVLR